MGRERPIWPVRGSRCGKGIVAVPLTGVLHAARAEVVTEKLLAGLTASASRIAIIDITGVVATDTAVANHLIRTAHAVRMMGRSA